MNKLIKWFHHLFNPHCLQCKDDALEKSICQSCEVLKAQLEIANEEKRVLINSLIKPVEEVTPQVSTTPLVPIKPRHIPWSVKRQELERNDRAAAMSKAKAAPIDPIELQDLENEVLAVEEVREGLKFNER